METAIDARVREPWSLYRMARTLSDAGHVHLAYAAAGRLMAAVPSNVPATAAAAIARLAYPAPWADQVQYYAEQYNIDPLLVYSMMRQESAFNPVAGSSASARADSPPGHAGDGAGDRAGAGQDAPFTFTDLARPVVAIQFGAYYLGTRVHGFGGNIYQALAAYNGGPGNAARWMQATGSGGADVDRFYEEVDYSETRLYLRTVLQNYAWYRYLYGAATAPP
ncbi:MAG: lytic transglycosylase domain-containing protein [Dehalococcoidia bacterium]